jgi:hypothetical protein
METATMSRGVLWHRAERGTIVLMPEAWVVLAGYRPEMGVRRAGAVPTKHRSADPDYRFCLIPSTASSTHSGVNGVVRRRIQPRRRWRWRLREWVR